MSVNSYNDTWNLIDENDPKGSLTIIREYLRELEQRVSSIDVNLTVPNGSITQAKLAADSVGAAQIIASAVGTSEINDLAVTDAKIASVAFGKVTGFPGTVAYTDAANVFNADQTLALGRVLKAAEGANAAQGLATLVAGTVTVNNTLIAANTRVWLTAQNLSGTPGDLGVSARVVGTSFTITSSNIADTRDIAWRFTAPA